MKSRIEDEEIEYVRGKVAAHDVRDDENNIIVEKGQTITDDLIHKACDKGKLHHLMLAAGASVVQAGGETARRRMEEFGEVSEEHEADFVRGKVAGREVKDTTGNVIISKGDEVTDELINKARQKGVLQKLVLAVGAPGVHAEEAEEEKTERERPAQKMGYTPYRH